MEWQAGEAFIKQNLCPADQRPGIMERRLVFFYFMHLYTSPRRMGPHRAVWIDYPVYLSIGFGEEIHFALAVAGEAQIHPVLAAEGTQ